MSWYEITEILPNGYATLRRLRTRNLDWEAGHWGHRIIPILTGGDRFVGDPLIRKTRLRADGTPYTLIHAGEPAVIWDDSKTVDRNGMEGRR
ncbi:hypothetical protein [Bifidobacterium sp. SO1]|uniref:hypothetical protein n=1 Tax=Bifidobacterium sp. SO1 TaxID=2809029 RepID=UPI001BDD2B2F|nr:hypothetical protein [Bifidobacterium sp. SO1]MBT1161701.1 hypothetical protein [Bifidobacterium sp. SO1]